MNSTTKLDLSPLTEAKPGKPATDAIWELLELNLVESWKRFNNGDQMEQESIEQAWCDIVTSIVPDAYFNLPNRYRVYFQDSSGWGTENQELYLKVKTNDYGEPISAQFLEANFTESGSCIWLEPKGQDPEINLFLAEIFAPYGGEAC